jgi:hypothetical protein
MRAVTMNRSPELSLRELEQRNGARYADEHQCDANPMPREIRLVHCTDDDGETMDTWLILHFWLQPPEDAILGSYRWRCDVAAENTFPVTFCPFCGVDLPSSANLDAEPPQVHPAVATYHPYTCCVETAKV